LAQLLTCQRAFVPIKSGSNALRNTLRPAQKIDFNPNQTTVNRYFTIFLIFFEISAIFLASHPAF
jgi:hypothetical protein